MAIAPSPRSVLGGLAAAAVFLSHSLASAQAWTDRSLPPDQRAALLVAAMTQDEKIAFVHGAGGGAYVGHVPGIGRLGIPDLNLEDGPAGVADGMTAVTALPAPITLAASWDPDLAQRFGASIAAEQAGKGTNVVLGPMMNLDRAPAGGRNFEGFGEDPALAGAMAAAVVRGIQGAGLIATAKHYVDNEQETRRMTISSVVDDRTQHELYVLPFRACVDAGVGAVMCSYNQINGTFACEDPVTLGWLKGELGFKGWVMSDWGATHSTVASALAGLDMEMPGGSYLGATLASAVAAGDVPQSRLDDMVARVLASAFAAGLLDRAPSGSPTADVRSDAAVQLARDAAAQGTVLLKNSAATATSSALLPLQASSIRSIAVLGPAGDASPVFQGGGSSKVTATNVVTARQGIAARAGAVSVAYAQGAVAPFSDATSLAAQSDVAVVVVGVTSSEGADRSGLSLPAGQDQLISAVVQANPRTVVVVYAPAQVDMPWADQVPAIVFGGLPGQEEGDSLAAVLFGDVNPSGRLPMTFAAAEGDFPASSAEQFPGDGASVTYSEGFFIGYRHFDASHIAPLFPFGHGLSYTTFDYANLTVDPPVVDAAGMVSVSLDVTNTGATAGAEVVQLYVGLPAETSEPPLQLKGFQKVALDPGATQHVAFTLGPGEYSFFSAGRHEWIAYPGTYAVVVGSSSRDPRLTGSFDVRGGPLAGVVHQAEAAALSCSAAATSAGSGYTGAGYVAGFDTIGAAVTFSVTVDAAGPCPITARYSAVGSPRTLSVYVDGTRVKQATFAPLANPGIWDFETETLDLGAGVNTITYASDPDDTGQVALDAFIDCVEPGADAGAQGGGPAAGAGATPDAGDCAPLPLAAADAGAGAAARTPSTGFSCLCAALGATRAPADPSASAAAAVLAALAWVVRRRSRCVGARVRTGFVPVLRLRGASRR